jgi:non-ribosomal peptide synthetase component E (peptide arylation enzyme)
MDRVGVRKPLAGVVYQSLERLKPYADAGVLTSETLVSAFASAVRLHPERTALSEVGWTCTYAELDIVTDKAASAFLRLGLKPLDRVLFQLPNTKELILAFLGCLKAGLIPICTLAAHRQIEIGYLGRHASARAHVIPASDPRFDFISFSEEMRQQIPSLQITIAARGDSGSLGNRAHSLEALIASEDAAEARRRVATIEHDPYQVALFQLSGGTTDVPKIIPRFHNEYLYTLRTVVDFHGFDETLVAYTPNPMLHNAPMACVWGPAIFFGGEVAICGSLEAAAVGPLLEQRKPNWLIVPPVVLFRLKESGWLERIDFTKTKGFSVTSAVQRFRMFVGGAPTWPLFGMTEGLLAYCNASDPDEAQHTTVGRPLSPHDEVRILEPGSEKELPDDEVGELAIRGPCTIAGYFDAEERNKVAFTGDGFYRSGDLMRIKVIAGKRYLVFEGRLKDVVSRGGEKINCEEVERVAINHPSVIGIAIVAMPDRTYGERACAFIIPSPGKTVTVPELGAFLERQGLAKFKWPERIEFVAEFPLTSSGKLSKPKLREQITHILQQEDAGMASPTLQMI